MKSIILLERLLDLKNNNNLSPKSLTDVDNLIKKLDNNIKKTETNSLKNKNLKKQNDINNIKIQENKQNNYKKDEKDKKIIVFEDINKYPLITDSDLE